MVWQGLVHGAPLLFTKCLPSVCQVFAKCSPPSFEVNAVARDRHATDVYTSRPKGFPFATLRLYESILTRCACRPWILRSLEQSQLRKIQG